MSFDGGVSWSKFLSVMLPYPPKITTRTFRASEMGDISAHLKFPKVQLKQLFSLLHVLTKRVSLRTSERNN